MINNKCFYSWKFNGSNKSVGSRFLGLMLFIVSTLYPMSVVAQELPETYFDAYIIRVTNQHKKYIDLTLNALKTTPPGSLREAILHNQLREYYLSDNKLEPYNLYKAKAKTYWETTPITEDNQDAFGQYLFSLIPVRTISQYAIDLIDSTEQYIQNPIDRNFLKLRRFVLTSYVDDRELYVERYEKLLEIPDLEIDIKAAAQLIFFRDYLSLDYPDSAIRGYNYVANLPISDLQLLLGSRLYLVLDYLQKDDFVGAKKLLIEMKDILSSASAENTTFATLYHASMQRFFTRAHQYDSAAYYGLLSIEVFKSVNMTYGMGERYLLLSDTYEQSGNFEKAIETVKTGLDLLDEKSYPNQVAGGNDLFTYLISSYDKTDKPEERKRLLKEMEELISTLEITSLQVGNQVILAMFKANKGRYLTYRSQYILAERLLKESLTTLRDIGSDLEYPNLYLAELYLKTKKFSEAIKYASNELSLKDVHFLNIIRCHEIIVEAYIGKGMSTEAFAQFDRIKQLREDESALQLRYLMSESEVKQELESQKVVNASLASEQEVKAELIQRQQLIIIVIAFSVLIIASILLRLRALHAKNLSLLQVVEKEGAELQFTNAELGDTISELQTSQMTNQELLDDLSVHLNKMFNGIKGLKSFIPELGKLNNEQTRYLDRLSGLVEEEEQSLSSLIRLNSVLGNHSIDIRRVSLSDALGDMKSQLLNSLKLQQASLEVEMKEGLVFLADRTLVEMSLSSLVQHSLQQELLERKLNLSVFSEEGLRVILEFKSPAISQEQIDQLLSPNQADHRNYLSKLSQLKDLMDGELQYLCMGDVHKISLKLNLVELKLADSKGTEIDQLEIDNLYDSVMDYLVNKDGQSNADLSLSSLSEAIGISSRKISYVINTREKTNFSKFLAKLRIEKVKAILDNGDHSHMNISGIGYEAGFNSKSTFFSSFKEFVGCTPKEYLNDLSQKAS